MNTRLLPAALALLLSGCLSAVGENPLGGLDGGFSTGGGAATGGGSTGGGAVTGGGVTGGGATGGGVTGGGATGGGGGTSTLPCSASGFCWEGSVYGGTFHSVHGIGSSFVVAVGEGGVIATWNGAEWFYELAPTRKALRGVFFESGAHGWAVGDEGTILEKVGPNPWAIVASGTTKDLTAVHGEPGGTIYVGGVEVLMRREAGAWVQLNSVLPVTDSQPVVRAIRVVNSAEVYVIGSGGTNFFLRYNGGWVDMFGASQANAPTSSDGLFGLDTCGTSLFVSGSYSGEANTAWSRVNGTWDTNWGGQGGRVACITSDHFFSFGSSYYNNETITLIDASTNTGTPVATGIRVEAAYVAGPQDAWFVGDNGALVHWTGSMLAPTTPQRRQRVWAFSATDVWVLRGGDTMLRFDGTAWTEESLPGTSYVVDVFAGARDDVWLVRWGNVWHFANGGWNEVSGFPASTTYVRGSGPNDVWFSGGTGVVMHWNGTSLVSRFLPSSAAITGPMHVTATQRWVPTHTQNGIGSTYQWTTQWVDRGALGWRIGGAGDEVYFNGVGTLTRWLSGQTVLVSEGIDTDVIAASSSSLYAATATYAAGSMRNSLVRVALGTSQLIPLETGVTERIGSVSVTPDGHVWLVTQGGGLLHQKP